MDIKRGYHHLLDNWGEVDCLAKLENYTHESLLIYDLQSKDWINTYYMLKGTQATQSVNWNEMYKWKDDMKYPGYEPEQLCAHTISGQGTGISTIDHSATTPRAMKLKFIWK